MHNAQRIQAVEQSWRVLAWDQLLVWNEQVLGVALKAIGMI